jgi:hypothetical protein
MKAKKLYDEFLKEFEMVVYCGFAVMNCSPVEIASLKNLILSMRDNFKYMRNRGFITQERAQYVFDQFLISMDIYERQDLILGLFLDPLRVQKRPFKKDAIYTLIWHFGCQLDEHLYYPHHKTLTESCVALMDKLISSPDGYWGAVADFLSAASIIEADDGYTAKELKRQYLRLKNSKSCGIFQKRYMTYILIECAFSSDLPERRLSLAGKLSKLFPL